MLAVIKTENTAEAFSRFFFFAPFQTIKKILKEASTIKFFLHLLSLYNNLSTAQHLEPRPLKNKNGYIPVRNTPALY